MLKKILLTLTFLALSPPNVLAQELLAKFADWSLFTSKFGDKKICYIISLPIKENGNYYKRGEPYFLIIDSSDNIEEVNISSGYNYKDGSEVEISFGLKKFNNFTYKHLALASNKTDDIRIIKEMRRNLDVVVTGISQNNKYSQDIYSLIGFNQAFNKMKIACQTTSNSQ